jgi:chromosome partitioning protein
MPIIAFSSPKGGVGKSTCAVVLATELAGRSAGVTLIDADPNKSAIDWAMLPGVPDGLTVIGDVTEETIVDRIEEAAARTAFVIVDLEGTASLLVSYAISMADLVIIPMQGSQLDARQAVRQIKLIRAQGRIAGREIHHAVILTRTNPAITPRTQRHIEERFAEMGVPLFQIRLCDREAYRALFSLGGALSGLAGRGVSNLDAAIANAGAYTAEVILRLRQADSVREVA